MPRPTARRRNPRGQGTRLRDELIEAASRLLAAGGDASQLSIRAVAAAAGVTAPSIYRHFNDRAALLRAVVEEHFRDFDRMQSEAEGAGGNPYDALLRRCQAYLSFARQHPGHYRVLFSTTALGPAAVGTQGIASHPGAASLAALVDSVQRCVEASAAPDRDPFALAIRLWAWLHGFADLRIGKPEIPWPAADALLAATLSDLGLADLLREAVDGLVGEDPPRPIDS